MLANPLEIRGRDRVNNTNPEADLVANGWGNSTIEAYTGNSEQTSRFAHWAKRLVFKWLNRRSQRKSFTWATFATAWEHWQIPAPRVIEKPWPRIAGQYRTRAV